MASSILNLNVSVVSVFQNVSIESSRDSDSNDVINTEEDSVVISDETMFYIHIFVRIVFCGGMSTVGIISNVINTIIFYRMGANDSMGVTLMAQSLADLVSCVPCFIALAFVLWDVVDLNSRYNPKVIEYAIMWLPDCTGLISAWITVFLSVERCVCVVFPFKVKSIFTKTRTIFAVVAISLIIIAVYIPVFATQSLGWVTVPVKTPPNGTVVFRDLLIMKFADSRLSVEEYIDVANGIVLVVPVMVIVSVSVVWMVYGLHISSKIRVTMKATTNKDDPQAQNKNQSNLSTKERRLVKMVLILAIILLLCSIPRFIGVFAEYIFPNALHGLSNKNVYNLIWYTVIASGTVNCSANILAYLAINSAYRQKFKELFGSKKSSTNSP